eukprot:39170-Chlamydomonas_euryale.AAC.14
MCEHVCVALCVFAKRNALAMAAGVAGVAGAAGVAGVAGVAGAAAAAASPSRAHLFVVVQLHLERVQQCPFAVGDLLAVRPRRRASVRLVRAWHKHARMLHLLWRHHAVHAAREVR